MTDYIDRQAAIDALWGIQRELQMIDASEGADITIHGVQLALHKIEQLPSVQSEPQWIPVSERLPEVNGRYLVTRGLNACGSLWNRIYIVNYSDLMGLKSERIWWSGNVGKTDFERHDDVLAWMPLPETYKDEEEEA